MDQLPDKEKFKKLPIFFIVARERSGTTMLRFVFDAHPNVIIPVEFHFIWYMYFKYRKRKLWTSKQLEKFYDNLIKLPRFHLLTIDKEKLHKDIVSLPGEVDFATLCKVVLANNISLFEKKELLAVADKSPFYSLHTDKLLNVFPDAKIIHLTRDYRDNILSMLKVHIESHIFASLAYRWKHYNHKIRQVKNNYPDNFLTVRYEDFVSDPNEGFKQISSFLKLPFVPESLEFYKKKEEFMQVYPRRTFENVHRNLLKPITAEHVYGWKNKMGDRKVELSDSIIGRDAEYWGYERRYKQKNYWLLLVNFPGLAYGKLYYVWQLWVSRLPFGIKMKLIMLMAAIFKHRWRKIKAQQKAHG